jgi:hypothetical protein
MVRETTVDEARNIAACCFRSISMKLMAGESIDTDETKSSVVVGDREKQLEHCCLTYLFYWLM